MKNENKKTLNPEFALGHKEIGERYGVGRNQALEIIKQIKWYVGGGALGRGRVLRTECEAWEAYKGQQKNARICAQMAETSPRTVNDYAS